MSGNNEVTWWFRRVFHTFAASFLVYYFIPDTSWMGVVKIIVPILIVMIVGILEYLRLKGRFTYSSFVGLRDYERHRPASYLYFGVATLILLLMFPQQIAISCILCASLADPVIGVIRQRRGRTMGYSIGFLLCFAIFASIWYTAESWILLVVSIIGAGVAVGMEGRILWFFDDDFMMQMIPATLLLILWQGFLIFGVNVLPQPIIVPGGIIP